MNEIVIKKLLDQELQKIQKKIASSKSGPQEIAPPMTAGERVRKYKMSKMGPVRLMKRPQVHPDPSS